MIPRMGRVQNPPRAGLPGLIRQRRPGFACGGHARLGFGNKSPLKTLQRVVNPHAESEERVGIDQNRRKPPVGAVMQ